MTLLIWCRFVNDWADASLVACDAFDNASAAFLTQTVPLDDKTIKFEIW